MCKKEGNNNTNVNHLQMSLRRYELSVPSLRWFTDLRFIKVSPKGNQKPLLPLEGLLVAFEWWLYSTLAADGEFTRRTRRSSAEIRFLLAHKCQSPRFSASELGRRGNTGCSSVDKQTGRRARLRYSYDSFFFFFSCCRVLCYTLAPPRQTAPRSAFPPPASWGFLPVFKSSVGVSLRWLIANKQLRFPPVAPDFLSLYRELNWKR